MKEKNRLEAEEDEEVKAMKAELDKDEQSGAEAIKAKLDEDEQSGAELFEDEAQQREAEGEEHEDHAKAELDEAEQREAKGEVEKVSSSEGDDSSSDYDPTFSILEHVDAPDSDEVVMIAAGDGDAEIMEWLEEKKQEVEQMYGAGKFAELYGEEAGREEMSDDENEGKRKQNKWHRHKTKEWRTQQKPIWRTMVSQAEWALWRTVVPQAYLHYHERPQARLFAYVRCF